MAKLLDILLAQPTAVSKAAAITQGALIVVWHYTVLPGTLAAVDWQLGFGASAGGIPAPPNFDPSRAVGFVVDGFMSCGLLTFLLFEGLLAWFTFRTLTRLRPPRLGEFVRMWWRLCLPGIVLVPFASLAFAVTSTNYDLAMNLPLLWLVFVIIGMGVLLRWKRRFPKGHCANCGYNLTGLPEPRCPECGQPFEAKGETP